MSYIAGVEHLHIFVWEHICHQPDYLCEISLKITVNRKSEIGENVMKKITKKCIIFIA